LVTLTHTHTQSQTSYGLIKVLRGSPLLVS